MASSSTSTTTTSTTTTKATPHNDVFQLINRYRREDFEKFQILINSHITRTELNLMAEDLYDLWSNPLANSRSKSSSTSSLSSLKETAKNFRRKIKENLKIKSRAPSPAARRSFSPELDPDRVYAQLAEIIEYLSRDEAAKTDGIFRMGGSKKRQDLLRVRIERDDQIDYAQSVSNNDFNTHDVSNVLKGLLRVLPEPMFKEAHITVLAAIAAWSDDSQLAPQKLIDRQLRAVQLVSLTISERAQDLFMALVRLLGKVSTFRDHNRMTAENLSVVFVPTIFSMVCDDGVAKTIGLEAMIKLFSTVIENGRQLETFHVDLIRDIRCRFAMLHVPSANGTSLYKASNVPLSTGTHFVDMKRSELDHGDINTETELAGLYAHIQAMPGQDKYVRRIQVQNRKVIVDGIVRNKSQKRKIEMDECTMDLKKRPKTTHQTLNVNPAINYDRNSFLSNLDATPTSGLYADGSVYHSSPVRDTGRSDFVGDRDGLAIIRELNFSNIMPGDSGIASPQPQVRRFGVPTRRWASAARLIARETES